MVETTKVDGELLKVVRDSDGSIEKCVPVSDKELMMVRLSELEGIAVHKDIDGIDVWVENYERIRDMGQVLQIIHQHDFTVRSANFDRTGRKSEEKPGFMYVSK